MKKALVILFVLGLAAAVGYLLGTENGRQQRDQALIKIKSARGSIEDTVETGLADVSDAATATANDAEVASV